jgi:excisionase family DNA binding protein
MVHSSTRINPHYYRRESRLSKYSDEHYPEFLTTGAVARRCGVSKVTVLRWIEKGTLVSFKLPSGQNRISRADFFSFARRHGIPTDSSALK